MAAADFLSNHFARSAAIRNNNNNNNNNNCSSSSNDNNVICTKREDNCYSGNNKIMTSKSEILGDKNQVFMKIVVQMKILRVLEFVYKLLEKLGDF